MKTDLEKAADVQAAKNTTPVIPDYACKIILDKAGRKFTKIEPTIAVQMDEGFSVKLANGNFASGQKGDWLAVDSDGYYYPIKDSVFQRTYRPFRKRKAK